MVVPSLSHALCGSNNFEQPTQLPTNFMEMEESAVNDQITLTMAVSSTLTTLTSTSGSYDAELRASALTIAKSADEQNVHFDSTNHQDSLFGGAEDNAKEEEVKEKSDGKETQESKLISAALVDLVNMVNKIKCIKCELFPI
jgi:hypothetical protein